MTSNVAARAGWLGIAGILASLCGCQSPGPTAREQAALRWNEARAQVKFKLAADQFAAGNVAAAADELAEAARLTPDKPDLVPLQARVWLAEGETGRAAAMLENAQLEGRRQAEVEYLLGIVRQQQQRWDDALRAFQRAAELDDEQVAYVVAVAQVQLQLDQPQAALDFLTARSARFGLTNAYQAAMAECHEQLGDWSAAASAWQRVNCEHGMDTDVHRRLAEALYRAERYHEALPVLHELLIEADGNSIAQSRVMLAECLLACGRLDAAREQAQAVLLTEPGNLRALRLLARGLAGGGEHKAALRVARRALAVDADDVLTLELVSALAWRAGDGEFAAATAKRLLDSDPQNPVGLRVQQCTRGEAAAVAAP